MSEQRLRLPDEDNEPLLVNPETVTGAQVLLYRMINNGRDPDTSEEWQLVLEAANRDLHLRGLSTPATNETLEHVLTVLNVDSE